MEKSKELKWRELICLISFSALKNPQSPIDLQPMAMLLSSVTLRDLKFIQLLVLLLAPVAGYFPDVSFCLG